MSRPLQFEIAGGLYHVTSRVIVVRKFYRQEFDDAKQGMIAAYGTGDYTLQAIADTFEVHYRR